MIFDSRKPNWSVGDIEGGSDKDGRTLTLGASDIEGGIEFDGLLLGSVDDVGLPVGVSDGSPVGKAEGDEDGI